MNVDGSSMNDVEQQVLHNSHNFLSLGVVSFDWTEGFGQNAVDSPWHIQQFLHEECGSWILAWFQRLH